MTAKKDPDAGTSTMRYDVAGNLVQTTDARGKTISRTYDALNRKTGEYDAPVSGQSPSNQLSSWVYDNANNAVPGMKNAIGHLTTATAYVGGNAYVTQTGVGTAGGFNAQGESSGETITIPAVEGALAGSYTFTHSYTSGVALPNRDSYPASPAGGSLPGETVTHDYSGAMDFPTTMGGLAAYTANVTATPFGQVAEEQLGLTQSAHAYIDNVFDQHTGALIHGRVRHRGRCLLDQLDTRPAREAHQADPARPQRRRRHRHHLRLQRRPAQHPRLDQHHGPWAAVHHLVRL